MRRLVILVVRKDWLLVLCVAAATCGFLYVAMPASAHEYVASCVDACADDGITEGCEAFYGRTGYWACDSCYSGGGGGKCSVPESASCYTNYFVCRYGQCAGAYCYQAAACNAYDYLFIDAGITYSGPTDCI